LSEGESHLPPSAEKASKQCLVQLRNLQKIWQPALPEEVYLRALGTLSNVLLEELLIRITAMEVSLPQSFVHIPCYVNIYFILFRIFLLTPLSNLQISAKPWQIPCRIFLELMR